VQGGNTSEATFGSPKRKASDGAVDGAVGGAKKSRAQRQRQKQKNSVGNGALPEADRKIKRQDGNHNRGADLPDAKIAKMFNRHKTCCSNARSVGCCLELFAIVIVLLLLEIHFSYLLFYRVKVNMI